MSIFNFFNLQTESTQKQHKMLGEARLPVATKKEIKEKRQFVHSLRQIGPINQIRPENYGSQLITGLFLMITNHLLAEMMIKFRN
jgi:hypothetical protein